MAFLGSIVKRLKADLGKTCGKHVAPKIHDPATASEDSQNSKADVVPAAGEDTLNSKADAGPAASTLDITSPDQLTLGMTLTCLSPGKAKDKYHEKDAKVTEVRPKKAEVEILEGPGKGDKLWRNLNQMRLKPSKAAVVPPAGCKAACAGQANARAMSIFGAGSSGSASANLNSS